MDSPFIAEIAYAVNNVYRRYNGESERDSWDKLPEAKKRNLINAVDSMLNYGSTWTPEVSHMNWLNEKIQDGWRYSNTEDEQLKLHPCIKPYYQLPDAQKKKDELFVAVVNMCKNL